jgi:hypothetical protein
VIIFTQAILSNHKIEISASRNILGSNHVANSFASMNIALFYYSSGLIPFLCEDAPNLAHAGGLRSFSREFTRRVIKRSLIKNWYYAPVRNNEPHQIAEKPARCGESTRRCRFPSRRSGEPEGGFPRHVFALKLPPKSCRPVVATGATRSNESLREFLRKS